MATEADLAVADSRRPDLRGWLSDVGPFVTAAVVCVWVLVAIRALPSPYTDYGVFLAIAERLKAGDRLYADVWDNKDPLIYLSLAVARVAGTAGAWLLELVWLGSLSVATYAIARSVSCTRRHAAVVGLLLSPLVALGYAYFMGTTHLPGVALTLVATALALRSRYLAAGLALGALALFKLVMLPLGVVLVIVAALSTRGRTRWMATVAGFVLLVASVLVLLAARGEFTAYVESLRLNVGYSQTPIDAQRALSTTDRVMQHLEVMADWHILVILGTTVAIIVLAVVLMTRLAGTPAESGSRLVVRLTAAALAVEFVTLAVTGKLVHHNEILVVSSLLSLVLLVLVVQQLTHRGTWLVAVLAIIAAVLLAGVPTPRTYAQAVVNARITWASTAETDPVTAILVNAPAGSFALIGQGSSLPRSEGLADRSLACPQIAQRPIDPPAILDDVARCVGDAQVVVVAPDAVRYPEFPNWNTFLDTVADTLDTGFDCRPVEDFQVCTKR